jgi:hypothetical protein
LISALAFLDLVERSLCVQLTAFAQARLWPRPDRAASVVRRTPVHECVKMLPPIVIAITIGGVNLALFAQLPAIDPRRADPRAGGVAAIAVVMPAYAGIHVFLMAFDQSCSLRRMNSAIFLTTSSSIPA